MEKDLRYYAKVHSIESFGTVDGPGLRFVLFLRGCHLQCKYCHNRDTWDINGGEYKSVDEIVEKINRYKNYIIPSGGGVTVTGGEPLIQASFVLELFKKLKENGIHTCVDTSGMFALTDGIKELSKKYNAIVYKAEPDILSSDEEYRKIVTNLGYRIKDNAKNFREEIQPRYVFRLDIKGKTEDEIFAEFHSKTRYNVRLATRKGVVVKEGTREDLKEFHKIMVETGARDGFIIRPLSYFEKMYDELAPNHMKLLMAYYEGKPISGVIPIFYGNKTWYLYGASSNEHRNLMPNYLLQWEMIKMAIARHDDIYDFRGVVGNVEKTHPQYGLYRFKQGFGADLIEWIGEIYMPFKPITYKLYRFSEKAFRTIRQIKRKIAK